MYSKYKINKTRINNYFISKSIFQNLGKLNFEKTKKQKKIY